MSGEVGVTKSAQEKVSVCVCVWTCDSTWMTQVKNTRETTISKEKEEEEGTSWTFAVELECASGAKSLQSHLVTFAHKRSSILKQFCGKCTLKSLMHWLKYWLIRKKRFSSYVFFCVLWYSLNFLLIRCTPLVVKYKNESEFERALVCSSHQQGCRPSKSTTKSVSFFFFHFSHMYMHT